MFIPRSGSRTRGTQRWVAFIAIVACAGIIVGAWAGPGAAATRPDPKAGSRAAADQQARGAVSRLGRRATSTRRADASRKAAERRMRQKLRRKVKLPAPAVPKALRHKAPLPALAVPKALRHKAPLPALAVPHARSRPKKLRTMRGPTAPTRDDPDYGFDDPRAWGAGRGCGRAGHRIGARHRDGQRHEPATAQRLRLPLSRRGRICRHRGLHRRRR